MIQKTVKIINRLGMHARPSAMFVKYASQFRAEIVLEKKGKKIKVNGKSIMGVMMLAAARDSEIIITADGPDEKEAVKALVELINSGFGELKDL